MLPGQNGDQYCRKYVMQMQTFQDLEVIWGINYITNCQQCQPCLIKQEGILHINNYLNIRHSTSPLRFKLQKGRTFKFGAEYY